MQNSKEKPLGRTMVCVRSSVNVNPAKSFNEWTQYLADEEARFDRIWNEFKQSIIQARTINPKNQNNGTI